QDIYGNAVTDNNVDIGMEEKSSQLSNKPYNIDEVKIYVYQSSNGKQLEVKVNNAEHIYFTNIKIFDIKGMMIVDQALGDKKDMVLNLENKLVKGIYILKISNEKTNHYKKFLVQ
ncbi:MAG: T9SS type A sorting domain-containing protein, partial [Flavobacteriaceae bacterium]